MYTKSICVLLLVLAIEINFTYTKPIKTEKSRPAEPVGATTQTPLTQADQNEAYEYLQNKGYFRHLVPRTGGNGNEIPTDPVAIQKAVKRFQRFYGIYPTGSIDIATIGQVRKPGCALSDFDDDDDDDDDDDGTGHQNISSPSFISGDQSLRQSSKSSQRSQMWENHQFTYFVTSYTPDIPNQAEIESTIQLAFQKWTDASNLVITKASNAQNADIKISFTSTGPYVGQPCGSLAYAYTLKDKKTQNPNAGKLVFDDAEQWSINSVPTGRQCQGTGTMIDLLEIAIHEIGHNLGLHHSMNRNAIMFGEYTASKHQLHQRDRDAIQQVHGGGTGNGNIILVF